ncbi:MAG: McrC family protein, partial [Desulfosalsimonas sp.]
MQAIELKEHEGRAFDQDVLDEGRGHQLWLRFGNKIEIDPPTFKTGYQWHLKPKGWVGHIPIDNSLSLIIRPKVELGNLFGMLEYAYRIPFTQDEQLIHSDDLPEFYQRLANILARQVLRRTFCGLYKEYISRRSRLPFVRGRIDTTKMLNEPWQVNLTCHYQENTSDNEENQILVWTLFCIAQTGLCQGKIKNNVRQAYRGVHNFATLMPKSPFDCVGRHYTRLNCDYKQMHTLCRFFLEVTGPLHEVGKKSMLPFMVDMPKLYESFVTEWLKVFLGQNYPGRYRV